MTLEHELKAQANSANEYVNKRYAGYGLKYHTHVIKGLMEGAKGQILDVGCGTGIIHDLYPKLNICGIDISEDMLKYHKGYHIRSSADDIPYAKDSFDFVVCRSVLHHLPDVEAALIEIKRVLKPGGKLVCWETNAGWLAEKIRHFTQHGDRFSEFHHSFQDLPALIEKYFKIDEIKYEGYSCYALCGFPDIIDFSWLSGPFFKPLMVLDEMLSKSPLKKMGFAIRIKGTK